MPAETVYEHDTYRALLQTDSAKKVEAFGNIAKQISNFDRLIKEGGEFVVIHGTLLRLDISGFSKLNNELTSVTPIETFSDFLRASAAANALRADKALVYQDNTQLLAESQATEGQQYLIDLFNERFEHIAEIIAKYGGRIINFEGDAINVEFPEVEEALPENQYNLEQSHHRAITAGLEIQDVFNKDEHLRARVGIRPTDERELAVLTPKEGLVFMTGKPFEELCVIEASTPIEDIEGIGKVGQVGTKFDTAALLPGEVFYKGNKSIWIQMTGQAAINAGVLTKEYIDAEFANIANLNPYKDVVFKVMKGENGEESTVALVALVNPEAFPKADPLDRTSFVVPEDKLDETIEQYDTFNIKRRKEARSVNAVTSYFAIHGLSSDNIETTQKNISDISELFKQIKDEFGIRFIKTGIDDHGNNTFITIAETKKGESLNPALASVKALLKIQQSIQGRFGFVAGIAHGDIVKTAMGSKFRFHDDLMGMTLTGAARIEQKISAGIDINGSPVNQGIFIDESILGLLRAQGVEPVGTVLDLQGIKGFPNGLPVAEVRDLEPLKTYLLDGVTTYDQFKAMLSTWAASEQIEIDDIDKVMEIVKLYGGDESLFVIDDKAQILGNILYPLLRNLENRDNLFQIHRTLSRQVARSHIVQNELEDLAEKYKELIFIVSAITGGSNLEFDKNTLIHVATKLGHGKKIHAFIKQLTDTKRLHEDDKTGMITMWAPLQRRAYQSITNSKVKLKYHRAITKYLKTTNDSVDKTRSLAFQTFASKNYKAAKNYLYDMVHQCRSEHDWEGVMLYNEMLLTALTFAPDGKNNNRKAIALFAQGLALVEIGKTEEALNSFDICHLSSIDERLKLRGRIAYIAHSHTLGRQLDIDAIDQLRGLYKEHIDDSAPPYLFEEDVPNKYYALLKLAECEETTGVVSDEVKKDIYTLYSDPAFKQQHYTTWLHVAHMHGLLTRDIEVYKNIVDDISARGENDERYASIIASSMQNIINDKKSKLSFDQKEEMYARIYHFLKLDGNLRELLTMINNRANQQLIERKGRITNPLLAGNPELPTQHTERDLLEGIDIARALNYKVAEANIQNNLANLYLLDHKLDLMNQAFIISLNLFQQRGLTNPALDMMVEDILLLYPDNKIPPKIMKKFPKKLRKALKLSNTTKT